MIIDSSASNCKCLMIRIIFHQTNFRIGVFQLFFLYHFSNTSQYRAGHSSSWSLWSDLCTCHSGHSWFSTVGGRSIPRSHSQIKIIVIGWLGRITQTYPTNPQLNISPRQLSLRWIQMMFVATPLAPGIGESVTGK